MRSIKRNKWLGVLTWTLLLTACGRSSDPLVASANSLAEAFGVAEKSGAIPVLNRDATVAGPDLDNNGIRDDIDAYIASLPDTDPQKAALRQMARALQKTLTVDTTDKAALGAVSEQQMLSINCIGDTYKENMGMEAYKMNLALEKFTVNTKIRFAAYDKYNRALSGTTSSLPQGDSCAK